MPNTGWIYGLRLRRHRRAQSTGETRPYRPLRLDPTRPLRRRAKRLWQRVSLERLD